MKSEPFCISSDDDLNILCQYISEDNQGDDPNFNNEDTTLLKGTKVTSIKNLFKKCVGYYFIYTPETHPEAYNEVQKVMHYYYFNGTL